MSPEFILHLLISAIIIYILVSWFKIFLNLRGTIDFGYIWIIIFWAYSSALLNINFELWILSSIFLAFFLSLPFTFLLLYLSSRLSQVYFVIWSLSLYMLILQIAQNVEITGWALWLSWMNRDLIWGFQIYSLQSYFIFSLIAWLLVIGFFTNLKKTYFFKTLEAWWENENSIKALWIKSLIYRFFLISITTFLAVLGGGLFSFYYQYISPSSFWLGLLIDILIVWLIAFKMSDSKTLLVAIAVVFVSEYLRFFKIVEASKSWYLKEMIFALAIIVASYFVFKKIQFNREI